MWLLKCLKMCMCFVYIISMTRIELQKLYQQFIFIAPVTFNMYTITQTHALLNPKPNLQIKKIKRLNYEFDMLQDSRKQN